MSHRPHPAQDIIPGSRWPCREGLGCAIVKASAAGWVDFIFTDGAVGARQRLHHTDFRRQFAAPYDSRAIRSQFAMCMANLQAFHAFWGPQARRIFARSTNRPPEAARAPARGSPEVPADAIYIGTYSNPFAPETFLADLNDALATTPGSAAA